MTDEGATITFGESATETILDVFDWETDDDGYVVDQDGGYAPSTNDTPVKVDDVAGVVDIDGKPVLLPDHSPALVEWVSDSV